jgi:hypothetical protein
LKDSREGFIRSAREVLVPYGRDYAIGAVRGLAVRNMMSVTLPETTEGFYPIVKVHLMALKELEEIFYNYIEENQTEEVRDLIMDLVERGVWE